MKKYIFVISVILMVLIITPLFTQEETVYIKNFPIVKVYSHRFGYKVNYWTSKLETAFVYIPMAWFTGTSSKAEIVLGDDMSYPYLSVVWIDGKFDHVRIYAHQNFYHYTWGVLKDTPELIKRFEVTDLKLRF